MGNGQGRNKQTETAVAGNQHLVVGTADGAANDERTGVSQAHGDANPPQQ